MSEHAWLPALEALLDGGANPLSNLANAAALLGASFGDVNWIGFYLLDRGALWLGPFFGKPACLCIDVTRGVCGAAFSRNETVVVPDVHAFPGHIACDEASRSELVVPLRVNGRPVGVLDADSASPNRFGDADRAALEAAARLIEASCDFAKCGYDMGAELHKK